MLAFDSNLSREISLTLLDERTHELPEELVRSFSVQAEADGQWREVYRDEANHLRFRAISFDGLRTRAVRLVPEATRGSEAARVYTLAVNEPTGEQFE